MNLFGKKKAAPAPRLSDSIQKLREANLTLEKREKHLQKLMDQALSEARKRSKAKDKRGAIFQLKRKKMFEKQIDQIYGKKHNIEMQIMALESAAPNREILQVMKSGKDALQQAVHDTDIDKVEDVMEDINESIQVSEEFGEALSQPIGAPIDETDLEHELEEMESEMMDEDLLEAPNVPAKTVETPPARVSAQTVDAPQPIVAGGGGGSAAPKPAKVRSEEKELAELEALMGM